MRAHLLSTRSASLWLSALLLAGCYYLRPSRGGGETRVGARHVDASDVAVPAYLGGCSADRGEPLRGPLDLGDPRLARGQEVFMAKCNKCHPGGDAGLGRALNNKPLPGFLVRYQARHGPGAMPDFGSGEISGPDLDDMVAFLKALRRNG